MSVPFRKVSPFITYTPDYVEMISDPNYSGALLESVEFAKKDTMWTLLTRMAKEIPNDPLLGTRQYDKEKGVFTEYKFITYAETEEIASQYASGLVELGLKRGDVCTEYFSNRAEWVINDLALFRHGAGASPLRHELNAEHYKQIIKMTKPICAVVATDNTDAILDICEYFTKDGTPLTYKFIVVMPHVQGPLYGTESIKAEQHERAKALGITLYKWEEVIELGKAHPHPEGEPDPLALHTILFTSGTTSDQPKGVPITQRGFICFNNRHTHMRHLVFCSYIHMSHVSDRGLIINVIGTKGCVGFISRDLTCMLDDFEVLRPQIILAAPIVLKTFQSKALEVIRSGVPEEMAKAIFRKKFGGRCTHCVCFGAPCPEELCHWLNEFLGMYFTSSYGLTEAGGSVCMTPYTKEVVPFGCIGQPGPITVARIIDAPEQGFSIHDDPPCGELLIRSPGNMVGYLDNPEKTAAAIDKENFLHTNDIVKLNDDGSLTIVDRRDNMMKLANAAYIPPEKIESFLGSSHLVAQSWVHARKQDDFIVSVIVPNLIVLAADSRLPAELKEKALAAAKNPASAEAAEICADERVKKIFLDEFTAIGEKNNFPYYWFVKGLLIDPIRWTEAAGLLTYTNKLKRRGLIAKYSAIIDELVSKL